MQDSQETQRSFLKPQNNPQKFNQPIFYKTRFSPSKEPKIKRHCNGLQIDTSKDKSHLTAKDQEFKKTSSGFSNSQNFDFTGDYLDFNSYKSRKQSRRPNKTIKTSKSVQNKIELMNQHQQNLFKKMTIHCVRAERQVYQNNSKQIQRQLKYSLNKISKQRKARFFSELKVKKLEKIKEQRRKFSQELQKARKSSLQKEQDYHRNAKNAIIIQRENTQSSVERKIKQNKLSASHQRINQSQIHSHIQTAFQQQLSKKKGLYQKQRQAQWQRKRNIIKNKQLKKTEAIKKFRNKWLSELKRSNMARQIYKQKKQKLENTLKKALQSNTYHQQQYNK